jgi:hypothetical protein
MDWIILSKEVTIPISYFNSREKLLLKDVNGFIGVGWYNSYGWVLDTYHDIEHEIEFDKIVAYCIL